MKFNNDHPPNILNINQENVLIGSLLGDGHLSLDKRSKYPRLKIDRAIKDLDYLKYQFSYFKDLCKSNIKIFDRYDKRYNKSYTYCSFRTRAIPAFIKYYNEWYENKIRIVPKTLKLNPLILSIWFSDDGCVIRQGLNSLTLKLSTENFSYDDILFLKKSLVNRFGVNFPIYKKGKGFIIKASSKAAFLFLKEIQDFIKVNGMKRKYDIWKDYNLDVYPKIGRPKIINYEF